MKETILIVEDEFIVANDLRIILNRAGYQVCAVVASVAEARAMVRKHAPQWVLIDIILKGSEMGTDLGRELLLQDIPFLYISANTNHSTMESVKETQPYGFLVKPFREWDLLIMLDIARHRHTFERSPDATAPAPW